MPSRSPRARLAGATALSLALLASPAARAQWDALLKADATRTSAPDKGKADGTRAAPAAAAKKKPAAEEAPSTAKKEPATDDAHPAAAKKKPATDDAPPATAKKKPAAEEAPATAKKKPAAEEAPATAKKKPATDDAPRAPSAKKPAAGDADRDGAPAPRRRRDAEGDTRQATSGTSAIVQTEPAPAPAPRAEPVRADKPEAADKQAEAAPGIAEAASAPAAPAARAAGADPIVDAPRVAAILPTLPAAIAVPPVAPPEPPPPAPPAGAKWYDRFLLEALADAYVSWKPGAPSFSDSYATRTYDTRAGSFQLAYAKAALSVAPSPVGMRIDLGFGPVADISSIDPGPSEIFKHIVQGYASFAIPAPRPIIVDVGKFYTWVGAEVIDASLNWNYSRSFLFNYGPFTHTGVRVTAPVTDWLTLQASGNNGWDHVTSGPGFRSFSVGAVAAFTGTSIALNYYGGQEVDGQPLRHLVNLVAGREFHPRFAMNLDAVYGQEGPVKWYGVSVQARVLVHKYLRIAARGEYFGDPDGARTQIKNAAGNIITGLQLAEGTLTLGVPIADHAEIRLEGRADAANGAIYSNALNDHTQLSATLAAIAWY